MGGFWVNHGAMLVGLFSISSVIFTVTIFIYRQGKHQGNQEATVKSILAKVSANCLEIEKVNKAYKADIDKANKSHKILAQRFEAELHNLENKRFVTHDQHFILCKTNKEAIIKAMETSKAETQRQIDNHKKTVECINTNLEKINTGMNSLKVAVIIIAKSNGISAEELKAME